MAGTVSGWFKRLARDDDQLHAEVLSEEVDATGSMRALICCQGDKVKLHGRLRYVDLRPDRYPGDPGARSCTTAPKVSS